jgi:transketolase
VFRPADASETAAAWTHALSRRDGPTCLLLTRQNLPALARPATVTADLPLRGAYVLREHPAARATLLATGAEVALAVDAAELLRKQQCELRVVSMPCAEAFLQQDEGYRRAVLGSLPLFALEMGRPEWWCQFTGRLEAVIGQTGFGASAPYQKLAAHFGFTAPQVAERIRRALG